MKLMGETSKKEIDITKIKEFDEIQIGDIILIVDYSNTEESKTLVEVMSITQSGVYSTLNCRGIHYIKDGEKIRLDNHEEFITKKFFHKDKVYYKLLNIQHLIARALAGKDVTKGI